MAWYDLFANIYDQSLEQHYRVQREAAVRALRAEPGHVVLDLPCGTGQSAQGLCDAVGPGGRVIGVDRSAGMRRLALARKQRLALDAMVAIDGDAATVSFDALLAHGAGPRGVDRLHIFLGMSVFPDAERCFENLWSLLAPGGRCVIVDVWNEKPGLQGHLVNLIAQADIRRRHWAALERLGLGFTQEELPSEPLHGGTILLSAADKSA